MTDQWEFVTPMISKRFMHEAVCLVTHWEYQKEWHTL